jgi:glycosyltransferase involved in cell wall biosynthesis
VIEGTISIARIQRFGSIGRTLRPERCSAAAYSMKIAIWHNLPSGGAKRALYDQVRGLVEGGHEVEAWCPPTAAQNFLPLGELIKENVVPLEPARPLRTQLLRRLLFARETNAGLRRMEDHCRVCAAEMAAHGFDLLLAHPCRVFHVPAIAQFTKFPSVLYLQEPYRYFYEALPESPWAAPSRARRPFSPKYWASFFADLISTAGNRIQVREELKWVKGFDQVLVNSQFSRESLIRAYNVDSRVCYLGIDTENFRPSGSPKERFVIGLGSFTFNKRPLFAVECIAAIPPERRPKLVWVGNSGKIEEVKQQAEKLGVDLEVHLLISDEKLRDLLSRAAVMIYASHLEPFGYAPLEGNACGTAAVGIAEGGVRETVNHPDSGVLIPNLDREAFGQALLTFCDDLDYAAEFGKRARAYVEKYWTKDIAAAALAKELARVVAASRGEPTGAAATR